MSTQPQDEQSQQIEQLTQSAQTFFKLARDGYKFIEDNFPSTFAFKPANSLPNGDFDRNSTPLDVVFIEKKGNARALPLEKQTLFDQLERYGLNVQIMDTKTGKLTAWSSFKQIGFAPTTFTSNQYRYNLRADTRLAYRLVQTDPSNTSAKVKLEQTLAKLRALGDTYDPGKLFEVQDKAKLEGTTLEDIERAIAEEPPLIERSAVRDKEYWHNEFKTTEVEVDSLLKALLVLPKESAAAKQTQIDLAKAQGWLEQCRSKLDDPQPKGEQ